MALQGYLNREVDSIVAGTSVQFERFLGDFLPSNGWYLQYSVAGIGQQFTVQSVADGDSHAITIPAATTANWAPTKVAILTGYAINPTLNPPQTFQVYQQSCPILPNRISPPADQPTQTFAQEMIAMLQNLLRAKSDDLLEARVGDNMFRYESKAQIREELGYWMTMRRVEVDKQRALNGKPSRRRMIPIVSITPPGPLYGTQWPSQWIGN